MASIYLYLSLCQWFRKLTYFKDLNDLPQIYFIAIFSFKDIFFQPRSLFFNENFLDLNFECSTDAELFLDPSLMSLA